MKLFNVDATAFRLFTIVLCLVLVFQTRARAQQYVWIESESPASVTPATVKTSVNDDGKPDYLSNGKWFQINIPADQADSQVPDSGIVVSYSFNTSSPGSYQIWNRIGYEAVRSDFEWRIDNGTWSAVKSADPTTDLVELQTWNPLAWIDMGSETLSTGEHTLFVRLTKRQDSKGKTAGVLYASDAICIYNGQFHPNDRFKPDDGSYATNKDKAAASSSFAVSSPTNADQSTTLLRGDWQIARDDEMTVTDPSGPILSLPSTDTLYWKSMPVPGNRDIAVPEWLYAHRYWLRTRITVPAGLPEHSYYLHFPATSMIATVFVNGRQCGFSDTPFAAWDCDVTNAINPGQSNSIWVGIKDWYYALPDYGAIDGGHLQYIPTDWVTKFGPANFTFPVWNHTESGLIEAPSFVIAGPVYTTDVFAKPSMETGSLALEITLENSTGQDEIVSVRNSVNPISSNVPVKIFTPVQVSVPAGKTAVVTVSEPFPHASLWWPDSPNQYDVVTSLWMNGAEVDQRSTKFGFRQWSWTGGQFALNGVPWHGRADLVDFGRADDDAVAAWHAHGQTMERMWGEDNFSGLTPEDALDFYDAHGIVIRRTGIFDGEAARYQLVDGDHVRPQLFQHWREQLLAWAKGQRNHPSIFIWSIENEIAFINAKVTGQSAIVDPAEREVADALEQLDPTRPVMTDGGNALLDESMPVYGGHYMEPDFSSLPSGAYDISGFENRQIWPITQSKPILLGEAFYANGDQPADFATVGGDSAFLGKAEAGPSIGLIAKMLSEGYRWNGVNFHFWIGGESNSYYNSWQPTAVLCREWNWSFGSGQNVVRTLRIFNDTHNSSPITLKWSLNVGTKHVSSALQTYSVAPGGSTATQIDLALPNVASRTEGLWNLTLLREGQTVFTDTKPLSILPRVTLSSPGSATKIAVYDPSNAVQGFLKSRDVPYISAPSLAELPANAKVLIVGRNALTLPESTSSQLSAYASSGRCVIVLEQRTPLKFQGLPTPMDTTPDCGDIAFAEDLDNPSFKGLTQQDFFTWGSNGEIYNNAYRKSASGGRSLIECGDRLNDCALVEEAAGSGVMLLCQLDVGSKLGACVVAQQLLANMVSFGLSYKQTYRATTAVSPQNPQLTAALDAVHLLYAKSDDPLQAISQPESIAVVDATPANLQTLATNLEAVDRFTHSGGWLVLNNVTPQSLASFDVLVGFPHIIRPFRQEKVTLPATPNPLTAGLSPSDIVMGNGQNIFNWEAGQYPDPDEFSYVVDLDDIAPFCTSSFYGWSSITNGFTMTDGFWPLIINFPAPANGNSFDIPISFPQQETVTGFTYVGDNNYLPQTKLNLEFGGGDNLPLDYDYGDVASPAEPETYVVNPPQTVSSMTLQITGWDQRPGIGPTIGVDNVYITVKRPADFAHRVRPMLNIGALVEYPNGQGGIVLCNVNFKDPLNESNPENAGKKQAIVAAILKNLDARFAGAKDVIAGAKNLSYVQVDLKLQVNQYLNESGWFGDKLFTFADFPSGTQQMAGVPYSIYSFATSPTPTVIMLGGNGVPGNLPSSVTGIAVNQKADALFFLQTARIDQTLSPDDIRNGRKFEIADYLIHFSDGTTAKAPIYDQIGVDNYKQSSPNAISGAQIAWIHPYSGTGQTAVAYSMEWQNPFPDKVIQTVDLVYGPDRWRGVPCLIALTAATAQ